MNQFDPYLPAPPGSSDPLLEGKVTSVVVTDPQPWPGGKGNHVVDPAKPFTLTVEWSLDGPLAPMWLGNADGPWNVSAYAESLGGGGEKRIGIGTATVAAPPATPPVNYTVDITVPAGTLVPYQSGTDISGVYKLVVALFLNSKVSSAPGYDLIGYYEGPVIQVAKPA